MPDKDEDLAAAIFGHSDSDLSSDEDDLDLNPRRDSPAAESSGDSGDEYVQEKKRAPKPKRRTKGRRGGDEEDEEGGGGRPQRKRKRASKRAPPEEIDLSQYPPEVAKKMELDMKLEAILKPKRGGRAKRKRKDDDDLDKYADEEVSRLREAMLTAAADDDQANREKLPATSKLRLLPQVMEVLRKTSLAQSIIDNNLLEGVRRWLEPLPDRSLPALDIQKEFFPVLKKMDFIDTNVLKDSKLGRVVLFYTKCTRVTPDVQRMANDLVSIWSRPIIKRSASYRDRVIPTAQTEGEGGAARGGERLNAILARARESDKNRVRKNAVMIPQSQLGSYTVAPRANAGLAKNNIAVDVDIQRRKQNQERLKSLTRKMHGKA
ncbi:hypothetical protein FKP32DRAFT_1594613 [Trametes sanguinea]|nr:hypothetical protein FKP32DRAFT_1594613 [Trametes sanguinea]